METHAGVRMKLNVGRVSAGALRTLDLLVQQEPRLALLATALLATACCRHGRAARARHECVASVKEQIDVAGYAPLLGTALMPHDAATRDAVLVGSPRLRAACVIAVRRAPALFDVLGA